MDVFITYQRPRQKFREAKVMQLLFVLVALLLVFAFVLPSLLPMQPFLRFQPPRKIIMITIKEQNYIFSTLFFDEVELQWLKNLIL